MTKVVLSALLIALFAACPKPGTTGPELFPLKSGSEWEYRIVEYTVRGDSADTTRLASYTVRIEGMAEAYDSSPVVKSTWEGTEIGRVKRGSAGVAETSFARSGSTYYRLGAHALYRYLTLTSPKESILVLPPRAGQEWHSGFLVFAVAGREDLTIQGRRYPGCWRVNYGPKERLFLSVWYAPGIGLVRQLDEREVYGGVTRSDYFLVRTNLKQT